MIKMDVYDFFLQILNTISTKRFFLEYNSLLPLGKILTNENSIFVSLLVWIRCVKRYERLKIRVRGGGHF